MRCDVCYNTIARNDKEMLTRITGFELMASGKRLFDIAIKYVVKLYFLNQQKTKETFIVNTAGLITLHNGLMFTKLIRLFVHILFERARIA